MFIKKVMIEESIKRGNQCIILDKMRLIGKIVKVVDDYVYVDFSNEKYAHLYVKDIENEKFKVNELGFWVADRNSFYDLKCEFVAPF